MHATSTNLDRPIGCKAEKEKRKNELGSSHGTEMKKDKKNKINFLKKHVIMTIRCFVLGKMNYVLNKRRCLLSRRKYSFKEKKEEETNTSAMSLMLQEYYHQQQMEILESHSRRNSYILKCILG